MSTLAERLKVALDRMPDVTQKAFAEACGVKQPSVADWLSGKTATMKADYSRRAAVFLRCRRDWLETGLGDPGWLESGPPSGGLDTRSVAQVLSLPAPNTAPKPAAVPVIGTLDMGADKMWQLKASPDGQPIGHVVGGMPTPGAFAVQVWGDELYPAVRHGNCLVVQQGGTCTEGELLLLEQADGDYLVCELVSLRDNTITVTPANGGPRRTLALTSVQAMHPVLYVASATMFQPA